MMMDINETGIYKTLYYMLPHNGPYHYLIIQTCNVLMLLTFK